ncbi:MAG: ATP-binding protein, partial [Candidatus Bathycorpusculaceae bacterium]
MSTQRKRLVFPFSAIVGLDKLKLAILVNAINPKIGGLLIKGPKGSGKSTIVRALADILPKILVVKDCLFNCNPYDPSNMCPKCSERYKKGEKLPVEEREMLVVDLPLGATEDRVIGSLDVEKAIKHGIEALEPGILAEANQNILYVDEVNLLPDHIADDLLDAAATGWNIVEREGISVSHPSRFIFIGTMNPEEGELRPQLLDRFPLSVTVDRIASVKDRMEIVKRNMEFEADPENFHQKFEPLQKELRDRIAKAK